MTPQDVADKLRALIAEAAESGVTVEPYGACCCESVRLAVSKGNRMIEVLI